MNSTISTNPNEQQAEYWLDEAFAFRELGNLEQALESCKKVLQVAPDNAEVHNMVGLILEDQGDLEGAVKAFQQATEFDPEFEDAQLNLLDAEADLAEQLSPRLPVFFREHLTNAFGFGGLLAIAEFLRVYIGILVNSLVRYEPTIVDQVMGNLFDLFIGPLLLPLCVIIGLILLGQTFEIKRLWLFALLGGLGAFVGSYIVGAIFNNAISFILSRYSGIGYFTAIGLSMGLASGLIIRGRSPLAPLLLGIAGAVGFGTLEYLFGYIFELEALIGRLFSLVGMNPASGNHGDPDGMTVYKTTLSLTVALLWGISGIFTGAFLSLTLERLVGGRDSFEYSVLDENTI